jgi:hypothetical protein
MRALTWCAVVVMSATLTSACAEDGEPWGGEVIAGKMLSLDSPNAGVYPDKSVLADPNNPFAHGAIGQETIWEIQARGGAVAAFYAWSTALARGANGERQYYAALNLKVVYQTSMAVADDMPQVRTNAIAGFQSMLDNFPDAVTYDSTGTITYDLATPCVESILELGGKVEGGWVLVMTEGGGKMAVKR